MKETDVASSVPPEAISYHWYIPPGADAVNVAVFPEHIVVPAAVGAGGIGFTVTSTWVLGPGQPLIVVCTK
jgi:hypothetical protein